MVEFVLKDIKDARCIKPGITIDTKLPEPIATVKFDVKFPGTYKDEVQPNGSWSVEAPVIGAYINPNDCGKISGWDIPENEDIPIEIVRCKDCEHWKLNYYDEVETCFEHRNVDGTEQATRPDDFCSWGKRRTNDA